MMKKIRENFLSVAGILLLITAITWQYSQAEQTKKNTEHRYWVEYRELKDWIKAEERECGEDGEDCNKRTQDIIAGWKYRFDFLGGRLGLKKKKDNQ